jgi:hypothetical protein
MLEWYISSKVGGGYLCIGMMIMDVHTMKAFASSSFCLSPFYLLYLITNFLLGKLPNKPLHNKGLGGGQVVGGLLWGRERCSNFFIFYLKGSFLGWPKYVHTMDFHFQEIMARV